jgi:hypothetical protein
VVRPALASVASVVPRSANLKYEAIDSTSGTYLHSRARRNLTRARTAP